MSRTLANDQAIEAREMYRSGSSVRAIAKHAGISRNAAKKMLSGKTYAELDRKISSQEMLSRKPPKKKIDESLHVGPYCGERVKSAKLTSLQVSYIKWHLNIGVSYVLLAKYFHVDKSTINRIASGIQWKRVKPHRDPNPLQFHRPSGRTIRIRGERLNAKIREYENSPH